MPTVEEIKYTPKRKKGTRKCPPAPLRGRKRSQRLKRTVSVHNLKYLIEENKRRESAHLVKSLNDLFL